MSKNAIDEYVELMPKLKDNLENLVRFYKNIDDSLLTIEKKFQKSKYSQDDLVFFGVYGKYFTVLSVEHDNLKREGKFENFEVTSDYISFLKKFYTVHGRLLEFFANRSRGQEILLFFASNMNYAKSAYIARQLGDNLHSAKQIANMTRNYLKMYELENDGSDLSNAKRSFLKIMQHQEKLNNKSVQRDINEILASSKNLEIALLIDGSIQYT